MSSPSDLIVSDIYRRERPPLLAARRLNRRLKMTTIVPAKARSAPDPAADPADLKSPKLSDFLCFAIYSANLAYGRAYKPILEKLGLTYTQYIAIVALWEEDNRTVSGLGTKLFLKSNTPTPIL